MKGTDINPIFIGHCSPMNAISSNSYTRFLFGIRPHHSPAHGYRRHVGAWKVKITEYE